MKILVDTSIIIDFLRSSEKENSLYFKLFNNEENTPCVCFVTITELYAGKSMRNIKSQKIVDELLSHSELYDGEDKAYKLAGNIIRDHDLDFQDALIAAVSICNSLPLLTFNKKHFKMIKNLILYEKLAR